MQVGKVNHLSPEQVEQLKQIGAYLRRRREELAMPVEEVAAKTLIRLGVIKALEEGQLEQLPEPIFIQGFIRRYGDLLQLNGTALAKEFEVSPAPVKSVNSIQDLSPPPAKSIQSYIPYIITGLLVLLCGLFLYIVSRPRTTAPVIQQQNTPQVPRRNTVPNPVPSVPTPPQTSPKTLQPTLPIQVTVALQYPSWLWVRADEKTQFKGTLNKRI